MRTKVCFTKLGRHISLIYRRHKKIQRNQYLAPQVIVGTPIVFFESYTINQKESPP